MANCLVQQDEQKPKLWIYSCATNYIQEQSRGRQQQQIIQVNQLEIDLSIGLALDCIRLRGSTQKNP
jgi:DNA-directed RNA polymerase specialized sigma24 family protein